jgi:hypothetical protein
LLLAAIVIGCDGGGEAAQDAAPDCSRADWPGPWTACPEADWVRDVAVAGGYRIVDETGSALVAEGGGDSFYIWTTTRTGEPVERLVRREGWQELGTVSGVRIYGHGDLWRWWATDEFLFWLNAGPFETSTLPDIPELRPLVAASLRLEPPTRKT